MEPAIELTGDPAFARRAVRLAATSAVALALIWWLAQATLHLDPLIDRALGGGWLLMPSILTLSLRWPRLRYALAVPSALIGAGLVAICATSLPGNNLLRIGWLLITGGVLLGGILGLWFWFRWMPVPPRLSDPFSPGRWALIAVHVCLVVAGLVLLGLSVLDVPHVDGAGPDLEEGLAVLHADGAVARGGREEATKIS